jgi:hypothetical protein
MTQQIGNAATVHAVHTNLMPQGPQDAAAPAALPNPEATLETARANYPGVSDAVLRGERSFQILSSHANVARAASLDLTSVTPVSLGVESGQVTLMPLAGVRGANAAEKQAKIVAYVNEGKAIYDQIMNGTVDRPAHGKEDMAKLMWYMQALASSKAAGSSGGEGMALYKQGGMFVEDPDRRLETFLLNANSYTRSSSHLHGFQHQGPEYRPHGADVRKVETPNERRTILFQRIPPQETAGGVKHMLFFKMEEHGCRGLSTKGTGRGESPVSAWHSVKRFLSNIWDTLGHGLGLTKSVRQRSGALAITGQDNRERVPKDAAQNYTAFIERAGVTTGLDPNAVQTRAAMVRLLEQGNPHLEDSNGIKGMIANLKAALAEGQAHNPEDPLLQDPILRDGQSLLRQFQRRGDHADLRIGNEVILTREEMIGQAAPLTPLARVSATATVGNEGRMSEMGYGSMLAGYQYLVDTLPAALELDEQDNDQFKKDMNRETLRIGNPGTEQTIIRNADESVEALRNLTDGLPGGERVEHALRALCTQALPLNLLAQCVDASRVQLGLAISPGNAFSGEYSILRRQDGDDAVFTVSSRISGISPTAVSYLPEHAAQGRVSLDMDRSRLEMQIALDVRVQPDGSITLEESADGASFAYSVALNDDTLRADRRAAMELALQFALADLDPQNPTAANGALSKLALPDESKPQLADITRLREEITRRVTGEGTDAANNGMNPFSRTMTPAHIQTIKDAALAEYAALLHELDDAPLDANSKGMLQGRIFATDHGIASLAGMREAVANARTIEENSALRSRMTDLSPDAPLLRILADALDKAGTGLTIAAMPDTLRGGLADEVGRAIRKAMGFDPRAIRSVTRMESEELAAGICRTFAESYQAAGQNPVYAGFFQPALLNHNAIFNARYVDVLLGQAASLSGQSLVDLGAAGNPKDILRAVDAFNTMLGEARYQAGNPEEKGGFGLKLDDSIAALQYFTFLSGLKIEELDAAQTEQVRSALFDGDWLKPAMQMLEFVQNHSDPNDPREMMDATALMGALGALRQSIGDKLNIPENELAALYTFPSITKLDDLPPEIRDLWPL